MTATSGRRRSRRILLGLAVVWLAIVAMSGLRMAIGLRTGLRQLDEARSTARRDSPLDVRVSDRLAQAADAFGRARRAAESPGLTPVHWLPVVGRQLRAVHAQAEAAETVSKVGAIATSAVAKELEQSPAGTERVALLRRLDAIVMRSERRIRVDLGPSQDLIGPLERRRASFAARLADADSGLGRAHAALTAAIDVLGHDRTYLVLGANNAEMRAGSGMFLSVGLLRSTQGTLTLEEMRPAGELTLPDDRVGIDGDLAARWGWLMPNRDFRNLGVTPRFEVNAALAKRMWEAGGGEPVDGVFGLDVEAVRAVLAATGPVDTGTRQVSADTVVDLLVHDQYEELGATLGGDQSARRDELGRIASAAVSALDKGDVDLRKLSSDLASAAAGRHLLAWSPVPDVQAGWVASGLSGTIDGTDLMVAMLNRGGNKLDHFLEVTSEFRRRAVGANTEVKITVSLTNHTPPGEPAYVAGPYPGLGAAEAEYIGLLSVSLPSAASSPAFSGGRGFAAIGPDGPGNVVATEIRLPQGKHADIDLTFQLPGRHGKVEVLPSARIPPTRWRAEGEKFTDQRPFNISW